MEDKGTRWQVVNTRELSEPFGAPHSKSCANFMLRGNTMYRKILLSALLCCALTQSPILPLHAQQTRPTPAPATASTEFARLIERLSEPGGYFDSDNLISNESSYQHVLGALRKRSVTGGAYIGVGPDTGFTYIAQIRPKLALMIDLRRDNLLQHFWFKAVFALSRNRLEYLCNIFGKPVPTDVKAWDNKTIAQIVEYLDKAPKKAELFEQTRAEIQMRVKAFGLPLKPDELENIKRIHQAFFDAGLELRFTSKGRGTRWYYPDYRTLLLEKDLTGKQCNYLVSEDDFQYVKSLEDKHLVIPVVGDLSGKNALANIGKYLAEKGEKVSAFYTSNVEFYLMRGYGSTFEQFAENVKQLPRDERSVFIRSYFNGSMGYDHPQTVNGYYSTQLLQTLDSFVKEFASGGYQSYQDLISKHLLDLR